MFLPGQMLLNLPVPEFLIRYRSILLLPMEEVLPSLHRPLRNQKFPRSLQDLLLPEEEVRHPEFRLSPRSPSLLRKKVLRPKLPPDHLLPFPGYPPSGFLHSRLHRPHRERLPGQHLRRHHLQAIRRLRYRSILLRKENLRNQSVLHPVDLLHQRTCHLPIRPEDHHSALPAPLLKLSHQLPSEIPRSEGACKIIVFSRNLV